MFVYVILSQRIDDRLSNVRPFLNAQVTRSVLAELFGTLLLALIVVGSGLQGPALGGDVALGLAINVLATVCGLWLLINLFAPLSGAHFNPVVTLLIWWRGGIAGITALWYLIAQLIGAFTGVAMANLMYLEDAFLWSDNLRANLGTGLAEFVATVGLLVVVVVFGARGVAAASVGVASWIGAAAFATSSTAFANPALSLARAIAADGAGIDPVSALVFVAIELSAIPVAFYALRLFENSNQKEKKWPTKQA